MTLKLIDGFGNPSTPGDDWRVGVSITNSKKKIHDVEVRGTGIGAHIGIGRLLPFVQRWLICSMLDATRRWQKHDDFSGSWGERPGTYVITYVAKTAGNTDLHLWREPLDGDPHGREAFPFSPYSLHVMPGTPDPSMSYVDPHWTLAAFGHSKTKTPKGAAPSLKEIADAQAAEAAAMKTITAGDTVSECPRDC